MHVQQDGARPSCRLPGSDRIMDNDGLTQYMRIALSVARRIADGELAEGDKISGRSKLSS